MKKNISKNAKQVKEKKRTSGVSVPGEAKRYVGVDLSDKTACYAVLEQGSEFLLEGRIKLSEEHLRKEFGSWGPATFVIEAGTHARWVARVLSEMRHQVLVANPRELRALTHSSKKSDPEDARKLAMYARADVGILKLVELRSEAAQQELLQIQVRDAMVRSRTQLVNIVRGLVKGFGVRVPACTTQGFAVRAAKSLPEQIRAVVQPLLDLIALESELIKEQDRVVSQKAEQREEVRRLRTVPGVGELTALTFTLIVEDPGRFRCSRDMGCYLGLRPRREQSGASDPQLGITKEGNSLLRRLLVQCAHRLLGPHGEDCALRRWGQKLSAGGKKNKKRAIVAVARKMAVLLHLLWVRQEKFIAFPEASAVAAA